MLGIFTLHEKGALVRRGSGRAGAGHGDGSERVREKRCFGEHFDCKSNEGGCSNERSGSTVRVDEERE